LRIPRRSRECPSTKNPLAMSAAPPRTGAHLYALPGGTAVEGVEVGEYAAVARVGEAALPSHPELLSHAPGGGVVVGHVRDDAAQPHGAQPVLQARPRALGPEARAPVRVVDYVAQVVLGPPPDLGAHDPAVPDGLAGPAVHHEHFAHPRLTELPRGPSHPGRDRRLVRWPFPERHRRGIREDGRQQGRLGPRVRPYDGPRRLDHGPSIFHSCPAASKDTVRRPPPPFSDGLWKSNSAKLALTAF
jgi:hypothetical protein